MVYIFVGFFEASTLFYMYALKPLKSPSVTMDAWPSILVIHQHHSSLDRASESDLHKRSWPASQPAEHSIDFNFSNFNFNSIKSSFNYSNWKDLGLKNWVTRFIKHS